MIIQALFIKFKGVKQMRYLRIVSVLLLMAVTIANSFSQGEKSSNIIPEPVSIKFLDGSFSLTDQTKLYLTENNVKNSALSLIISELFYRNTAIRFEVITSDEKKVRSGVSLKLNLNWDSVISHEGYWLTVEKEKIIIAANTEAGLFYGFQTLLQLIPSGNKDNGSSVQRKIEVPCVEITDYPRFRWRGLMLDVCRHFFTLDEVKKMIDEMVQYKFNILHLHLSDDQGWRIEIKAQPELTKTGAWRVPRTGLWWEREPPAEGEPASYGGFYTQEQIVDLVKYASDRHVQILPEIDVPGHSRAAIASYNYLSCTKFPYKVNPGSFFQDIAGHPYNSVVLCTGQEATYEFLEKVFSEIAQLFPFEYIHVGGDEAFKGFWAECDSCKKRMTDNNLKDTFELQSYFIKRIEKILQSKGRKLIGWDEILEGGLSPDATVMSWRGFTGGIEAAKQNHKVIMSPNSFAYLDLYQGDPLIEPPTYNMLRLETCYQFEPVPDSIDPSYVLGGQGNLWTESVPTFRHAEYMLWPRSFALAEVLWSPKSNRNWDDFVLRTNSNLRRLELADINFSRSFNDVIINPLKDADGKILIQLDTEVDDLDIYFTFDNTYPDSHSSKYKRQERLNIPIDADTFSAVTFSNNKQVGRIITVSLKELEKRISR
jgi:hexosaminidase